MWLRAISSKVTLTKVIWPTSSIGLQVKNALIKLALPSLIEYRTNISIHWIAVQYTLKLLVSVHKYEPSQCNRIDVPYAVESPLTLSGQGLMSRPSDFSD